MSDFLFSGAKPYKVLRLLLTLPCGHVGYCTVSPVLISGLALLASLSPLLTLAWLWQIKEWRFDRLREHLRYEGCCRQIVGIVRPAVVLVFCAVLLSMPSHSSLWVVGTLALLTGLTCMQLVLRKQHVPVWTHKATTLVGCALIVDALAAWFWSDFGALLVFLPILQAVALTLAWFLFWPVDRLLKTQRMQRATRLREQFPNLTVIGITGSVGKTTVKELLSCILSKKDILCTPAYVNSEMGVANWLLKELSVRKQNPPRILIVEMGAYRKGEIAKLCRIVQPSLGVVTYIGKQHVGLFGSAQALIDTKAELVQAIPEDGMVFLNADNSGCAKLAERAHSPVHLVSTGGHADTEAFDVEETATGIAFRAGDTRFSVPLHGTHNVTNVLLAIAVARALEMKESDIAQELSRYTPPAHTFSVRTERGVTILDDTHNASPASFKAAIAWAKSQPAVHKVLLTSGLIELGTEQDRIHTELGEMSQSTFHRVIFLHPRSGEYFEKGRGEAIEIRTALTQPVERDSLLVCVGRVPEPMIQAVLP
ncbi:hypothetical protein COU76_01785 [Candidatus Peregrinibacteria bacterium CG10_big_fil_rev_8_21_14_0_10_49_10]|nr:MAG: hypothetical protein COU76_01785 [Candidatus Peregrinibacteria bacterium CG10_big_fil_rev_8_21_14_0_10_49_10]